MTNTGSFTVFMNNHHEPLDIYAVSTLQHVLKEITPRELRGGRFKAPRSDIEEQMDFEDEDMDVINLCSKTQKLSSGPSLAKTLAKNRKQAPATDKRNYAKQFEQAKQDECNSWVD